MIVNGEFGKMVCLKGDTITSDTLENVIGQKTKNVNPDGELVKMAKFRQIADNQAKIFSKGQRLNYRPFNT